MKHQNLKTFTKISICITKEIRINFLKKLYTIFNNDNLIE